MQGLCAPAFLLYNPIMQNLNDYIKFLGLTKPVVVRVNSRTHKAWHGYYLPKFSRKTGKLQEHKITIYLGDLGDAMDRILAHELIHAWQQENNKQDELHGKHFRKMAKVMNEHFGLQEIYRKGIDTN